MITEEIPTVCPFCGEEHEAVTAARENASSIPDDGDVSICFKCGKVSLFDRAADGGVRRPTKKEQRDLNRSENLREILLAWKMTKRG